MKYLAVKNFDEFQHYKKRRPVWIKFYAATLSDYAFVQLPDAARAHLMLIWQLAAVLENRIPFDAKYIAQEIRATGKVDLDRLIEAGFLVVLDDSAKSASNSLAQVRESASLEGERETEKKEPSSPASDRESDVAALLPTDADRNALTALLVKVPFAETWLAEMRACVQGMPGHVMVTPTQLGQALRDYVGNGAAATPNMRLFRGYLESAARPSTRADDVPKSPPAMGTGGRAFLTTLAAIEDLP